MIPTIEIVPCGTGSGFACDAAGCTEEASFDIHTPEQWLVLCDRHVRDAADALGVEVPDAGG
jgi:hypothetical protein